MNTRESEATNYLPKPIPDDMLVDVLTRLPPKSLMRFRCVCKHWCSTIRDPSFVESYKTRSRTGLSHTNLLISFCNSTFSNRYFLSANFESKETHHLITLPTCESGHFVSQILNGLICFSQHNRAFVCNISTREIITLPISDSTTSDHPSVSCYPRYSFGFDPSTKEYKVLNVCTIINHSSFGSSMVVSEIFTLGTNSWEFVNAPPCKPHGRSVSINGAIHWKARLNMVGEKEVVVAFDIRDEKFRVIPLPKGASPGLDLIQLGEHLALVDHKSDRHAYMIELWILEDYCNQVWVNENINFPSAVRELRHPMLVGTMHTGELLLTTAHILSCPLLVFCYDLKTRNLRSVEISELPLSEISVRDRYWEHVSITNHVENILPLQRNN